MTDNTSDSQGVTSLTDITAPRTSDTTSDEEALQTEDYGSLTAEQRADRLVEVEEHLTEQLSTSSDRTESTNTQVEINPLRYLPSLSTVLNRIGKNTSRVSAPITTAELSSNKQKVTFTCEPTPGEYATYTFDLPTTQSDPGNKLARLCRSQDIPVTRVADLNSLPLVQDEDGHWLLLTPPKKRQSSITFTASGSPIAGHHYTSVSDQLTCLNHRFITALLVMTPFLSIRNYPSETTGIDLSSGVVIVLYLLCMSAISFLISAQFISDLTLAIIPAFLIGLMLSVVGLFPVVHFRSTSEWVFPE